MKYSISLAAMVGLASAAAVEKVSSPVTISLAPMGNTVVKATITNTGSKDYNIFSRGTILDTETPVNKLHVSKESSKATFHGIKLRLATKNLSDESFTALSAGESKEVMIDMAEIYGLSQSGTYDVRTQGHFRYAEADSTELVNDVLPYTSNSLAMDVNGPMASKVAKAVQFTAKRSTIQSDCTAAQKSVVVESEARCYDQATAAANAALNGSASKFNEYFKSTTTADRKYVANRLTAVAKECKSTPGGVLSVYCTDQYNYCTSDTFAYTIPENNDVVWCAQYYSHPVESTDCHGDDKAGTTIHEYTHADGVFSPGTEDYAYGYTACARLSRAQALENADTYEYYANAIHLGC